MLQGKLGEFRIILASGSPRRQQFFKEMGVAFDVQLNPVKEIYPADLKGKEIPDFLAKLKAKAFKAQLKKNEILITSDTVVWHKDKSLAKPVNTNEAYQMLEVLSNDWHEVITSVCFTTIDQQKVVNHSTKVKFKELTSDEWFYINNYKPFDKAGGYGIQEWIGLIGIEEISGSYAKEKGSFYISHKQCLPSVSVLC